MSEKKVRALQFQVALLRQQIETLQEKMIKNSCGCHQWHISSAGSYFGPEHTWSGTSFARPGSK